MTSKGDDIEGADAFCFLMRSPFFLWVYKKMQFRQYYLLSIATKCSIMSLVSD